MEVNLQEISDGKLYGLNDMVKVGCHDCAGCSECCQDMGQSILLDPYDIYRLTRNLGFDFNGLIQHGFVELHVEEGLILPNLKMTEGENPRCSFLNTKGRCNIHSFRPGICRLFPLGRIYEDDKLKYFLLNDACSIPNKTKMKIGKWLDMPQPVSYEKFLVTWHSYVNAMRELMIAHAEDEAYTKMITLKFLEIFYINPYVSEDFYEEFKSRMETGKVLAGM